MDFREPTTQPRVFCVDCNTHHVASTCTLQPTGAHPTDNGGESTEYEVLCPHGHKTDSTVTINTNPRP